MAALALGLGAAAPPPPVLAQNAGDTSVVRPPAAESPVQRTEVLDRGALNRLRRNSGMSLQWISWDNSRGHLRVEERDGLVLLRGTQQQRNGPGRLEIDGVVLRIDRTSFVFRGRIDIHQAPGDRAECPRSGDLHFRVTGSRRYWRMQEMETCGRLTDYVDIYF
ncbi:hypothetical protein [Roseococcus pinisoli]|uniref:hypothetical protein n=1 Tax=Roseococcus pinisoli TaxID=2835040 RepID=UPI001BCE203C|nr:hypothetical protein [Roseococcus pinisoli]